MSTSRRLRSPDWAGLTVLLDDLCKEKGLLTKSGTPSYQQLARVCGLSLDSVYAWRRRRQRPSRTALEKVAAYAGQPLGPWLEAAGLDTAE